MWSEMKSDLSPSSVSKMSVTQLCKCLGPLSTPLLFLCIFGVTVLMLLENSATEIPGGQYWTKWAIPNGQILYDDFHGECTLRPTVSSHIKDF